MVSKFNAILIFSAIMATSAGCADSRAGTWVITLPATGTQSISSQLSENYADDVDPDGGEVLESEWTVVESYEFSPSLEPATFVFPEKDVGYMIIDDEIFPGEKTDSGWVFTWTHEDAYSYSEEHESRYLFTEVETERYTTTLSIVFDGTSLSGELETVRVTEDSWSETDVWDVYETGVYSGQTPAYAFLYDEDGFGISNSGGSTDCESDTCQLSYTQTVVTKYEITGSYLGEDPDATFDDIYEAGQEAGSY